MKNTVTLRGKEYEFVDSPEDEIRIRRFNPDTKMWLSLTFPKNIDEGAHNDFLRRMVDLYVRTMITKPFSG